MKILLDTHILIWVIQEPTILTRQEQRSIARAKSLHLSVVSIWELRTKWNLINRDGRRKGPLSPEIAVAFAQANRIEIEPLTTDDCILSLDAVPAHRDPFDEMLLVHAQRLGARLLTRDDKLVGHPLAVQL